jgi:DnaJ-class molecular chaperone
LPFTTCSHCKGSGTCPACDGSGNDSKPHFLGFEAFLPKSTVKKKP